MVCFSYCIADADKAGILATLAVTFAPKPRLRLPSGDIAEPKVVHSRSWLPFAIAAWAATVVIGHGLLYGWLPGLKAVSPLPPNSAAQEPSTFAALTVSAPTSSSVYESAPPLPLVSTAPNVEPEHLPGCDEATRDSSNEDGEFAALPLDLSRSPFGALLDSRSWSRRCRGPHPVRVHLCVAVKDGRLLGATVRSDPDDKSTSRCILRAVSRLAFEPDGALRKVHVTIDLPSER